MQSYCELFYPVSLWVQMNFIFFDNVRILCLSCPKRSETSDVLVAFYGALYDVRAYTVVHFSTWSRYQKNSILVSDHIYTKIMQSMQWNVNTLNLYTLVRIRKKKVCEIVGTIHYLHVGEKLQQCHLHRKEKDGCGGISIFLCVIEKENKTIWCMINIFEVHIPGSTCKFIFTISIITFIYF